MVLVDEESPVAVRLVAVAEPVNMPSCAEKKVVVALVTVSVDAVSPPVNPRLVDVAEPVTLRLPFN